MCKTNEYLKEKEGLSQRLIKKLSIQPYGQLQHHLIENYYEAAISAINAGVWMWKKNRDQLYWDEKCFEITGIEENRASMDDLYTIVHSSDKAGLKTIWSRTALTEGHFDLETKIFRNGETRWLKISGNRQENGQHPNLINGLMFDITEEKEFREKLLESRSLFQSVVDDQTELICRFDANKIMTFSNKAFRNFFNIKLDDEESPQLESFFVKHDYIRFLRTLDALSPSLNVLRFIQKQSLVHINLIRIDWTIRGFFNTEGKATGYQFIGRDTSEIEIHRTALKKSEKIFRLIAENSKDIISINSNSGKVEYVSPSIQGILGYLPSDVIGTQAHLWVSPEDQLLIKNTLLKLSRHAKPQLIEYRLKNADGRKIWVESMIQNEFDNKGMATGRTIFVTRNIQKRKELEAQQKRVEAELIEANLTKDKFFTIIAHDLRSPFTSILGFSNLLYYEYDDFEDEERKKIVKQILSSSEATYQLIENLLAWAKTQLGKTSFNPEKVNIKSLIEETIMQTNAQALSKGITISFIYEEPNIVFADINMTRVVLRNLISNAIKYSNTDSNIKIGTRLNDKYIAIGVEDKGVGMKTSVCESLFNIRNKVVSTAGTANEQGTGLGLILTKEYVEINGGKISVQSEEGSGSFFEFTLPLFKG